MKPQDSIRFTPFSITGFTRDMVIKNLVLISCNLWFSIVTYFRYAALFILLSLFSISVVQGAGFGESGAPFLKIGIGGRATGLADAYTSICEGGFANHFNPAGIVQTENIDIGIMHTEWISDVRYEYLGFVKAINPVHYFAVSLKFLYSSDTVRESFDVIGEKFGIYDLALTGTYSRYFGKLAVGINTKLIRESYYDRSGWGFGIDAGVLYKIKIKRPSDEDYFYDDDEDSKNSPEYIRLGAALKNVGYIGKLNKKGDVLPMSLNAGISYFITSERIWEKFKFKDKRFKLYFLVSADLAFLIAEGRLKMSLGLETEIEYLKIAFLSLRAGYKTYFKNMIEGLDGLTIGLGFKYRKYIIDYAFDTYGLLGFIHTISLSLSF